MKKKNLIKQFSNPDTEYRAKPFWSWNGELEKDELIRQVGIMKQMGMGGYFMHSRVGLITEYLGKEWFELINEVADEGERLGLESWIYDEDRWPSGSAGGKVTIDPQYRMKSLRLTQIPVSKYETSENYRYLFLAKIDLIDVNWYKQIDTNADVQDVCNEVDKTEGNLKGDWFVLGFSVKVQPCTSNYNGTTYIDTMNKAATQRFIELTHEKYLEHAGDRIGDIIKGIFTDEPHRGEGMGNLTEKDGIKTCDIAWTEDIFDEFRLRYSYDAVQLLPELFYRPNGEKIVPIKHDYFDLLNSLFIERFMQPINDWCQSHNIEFTGHLLHEDGLTNQAAPNGSLMRSYEYMGCPGVDVLGVFSRPYWVPKQLASVARQTGKKWILSELYGCSGWERNFKEFKAAGDWQALFGINMRCPHLSWYTMEGVAKRDFPASILHQATWYPYFSKIEDYFARFGVFMTEGNAICDVLVLNPVESVWSQAYLGWANWIFPASNDVKKLEDHYTRLFNILVSNHIDFDYLDEQMLSRLGSVYKDENGKAVIKIGNAVYKSVVISGVETLRGTTYQFLSDFVKLGGKVVFAGEIPNYLDAKRSNKIKELAKSAVCTKFDELEIVEKLKAVCDYNCYIYGENTDVLKDVFVQSRLYDNGDIGIVLLNTELQKNHPIVRVELNVAEPRFCEIWDFGSGKRYDASQNIICENGKILIKTGLLPAECKAFLLTKERSCDLEPLPLEKTVLDSIKIDGEFDYRLSEKNVCVLDFASWRMDDGEWQDKDEILRVDNKIRKLLGLEMRGGSVVQPWYQKLNSLKKYGTVELKYFFRVEKMPDTDIYFAGERPEFMNYAVNGKPLNTFTGEFWVDSAFRQVKIPKEYLQDGENIITIKTDFNSLTNLEAVYVIGDFGVNLDGNTSVIVELPKKIGQKNLWEYNLPFYTGEVTYVIPAESYSEIKANACANQRFCIEFGEFYGALVKVSSKTVSETIIAWEPFDADVTEIVNLGEDIFITVVGNRKNVFGPLHHLPAECGACTPRDYVTEGDSWSDNYAFARNSLNTISIKRFYYNS